MNDKNDKTNVQNIFLDEARRTRTPVTVFFMNGFQMKGVVKAFDNFAVILEAENKQNMIYKHAISTVTPMKALNIKTPSGAQKASNGCEAACMDN